MIKNLRANGKGSYQNFNLFIASRSISVPSQKEITESVPFQNGSYDFSRINGEIAYDSREISYTFDIAEGSIEEMEVEKRKVLKWLSEIYDTDIFDDYIPDFHFHGTFITPEWSEEASQGALTAKFRVYPFMIANEPKQYSIDLTESQNNIISITNDSAHSVRASINCESDVLIKIDNISYSVSAGETIDSDLLITPGNYDVSIKGTGHFELSFSEEVL